MLAQIFPFRAVLCSFCSLFFVPYSVWTVGFPLCFLFCRFVSFSHFFGHVVTTLSLRSFPTHTYLPKYVMLTHQSFFLPCFALAACQCTPLHPSKLIPTLLRPSLPPVCLTAHVCIFGKFLGHTCIETLTLSTHLYLCLSCFHVPPCPCVLKHH